MTGKHIPLIDRFEKRYIPEPTSGCWLWEGNIVKSRRGSYYGMMSGIYGVTTRNLLAHRASYMLFCGEIPEGAQIDHKCQNTLCVNPGHLQIVNDQKHHGEVTASRNLFCGKGHPWNDENTWIEYRKDGKTTRHCRRCHADNEARKRKLRKAN